MPKKTTSYQKLKAENQSLRNDIYNQVVNENSVIGKLTWLRYQVHYDLITSAMRVSASAKQISETFQGFGSVVEAQGTCDKRNTLATFLTSPGLRVKNHLLCEKTKQKLNQLKNRIDGNHNS